MNDVEVEHITTRFTDDLDRRMLSESRFVIVIIQREIDEPSSNIPSMSVGSNMQIFSFVNNNYSLSLENASGTTPRGVTLVLVKEEDDDSAEGSSNFNYEFTESLAPFILLIIGLAWILLNALLFYLFKGFERYCKTEHFDRNSKFSTFWAML